MATTVLVVEDEPAIADAVVSRLRSEGFDHPTFTDAVADLVEARAA